MYPGYKGDLSLACSEHIENKSILARRKEFRDTFSPQISPNSKFVVDYSCAYYKDILHQVWSFLNLGFLFIVHCLRVDYMLQQSLVVSTVTSLVLRTSSSLSGVRWFQSPRRKQPSSFLTPFKYPPQTINTSLLHLWTEILPT